MAIPAITLEALPAGYGDSLLVSCPVGRRTWRLLIDTGPDECLLALSERLQLLPLGANGSRSIDLAVITHIDHDHIGSARSLFADRSLRLAFGDIWFNAPKRLATRGVAEGVGLASVLGETARGLPWNRAFDGQDVVTTDSLFVEVPHRRGEPRITILSPTRHRLDALYRVWAKELPKVQLRPEPAPLVVTRGAHDVPALAARATTLDSAPANGSSIAFLLEHRGAAALLTADAFPQVLVPALKALAAHRRIGLPWTLDLIKLSHHGSRGNTTTELMQVVRATDTLVSTNGAIFGHPDSESIARVIHGSSSNSRLWFNYRTSRTETWDSEELCRRYSYTAHYPDSQQPGVVIRIPPPAVGAGVAPPRKSRKEGGRGIRALLCRSGLTVRRRLLGQGNAAGGARRLQGALDMVGEEAAASQIWMDVYVRFWRAPGGRARTADVRGPLAVGGPASSAPC